MQSQFRVTLFEFCSCSPFVVPVLRIVALEFAVLNGPTGKDSNDGTLNARFRDFGTKSQQCLSKSGGI